MKLRTVRFADENACIADVERLAKGSRGGGAWSLAQACWHLAYPIDQSLHPPKVLEPTAEQAKRQEFIDKVIASGWPAGLDAPKPMVPPPETDQNAVAAFVASLKRLRDYRESHVESFVFGPVETGKFRQFALIHSAHHLNFFEPA
jgi:hypothetical protein